MAVVSSDLIVSVSGIRGIVGTSLTPEVAAAFAVALGTFAKGGRIVLSRDSRPSGDMLRHAVISGLLSTGCRVDDIGIAPTPTCGLAISHTGAAGGIQITASHNPAPWNGLKLFGSDGAVLSAQRGQEVANLFASGNFTRATWDRIGTLSVPPNVGEAHISRVCDAVSVSTIASAGFRAMLDGNGGAGGPLGIALLQALGCEIVEHACADDGVFIHEPEPIPAHLADVALLVPRTESHIGFVLDPDSDRLALIDETGTCVSEEITLALAVQARLSQQRGPVVINMSTSRVIEDIAARYHCECMRTAVGEANVVAGMRNVKAIIGGEGNGGVIDPRIGWVRDPFIAMPMILQLIAESGRSLSQLVADLPQYAMLKTKYTVERATLSAKLSALESRFADAKVNRMDGLRLDWFDRWLHIRSSNTEPIVRVIAEAPTLAEAQALCDAAGAML